MSRHTFKAGLCFGVVVFAALVGCEKRTREYRVGETAVAPDYTFAVLSVKECPAPGNEQALAHRGERSLGVEVSIESTGRSMIHSPTFGKILDAAGRTHTGTMYESCAPTLEPGGLAKGKKHRGFMTFHIPKDSRALELTYRPHFVPPQEVKFDLGR